MIDLSKMVTEQANPNTQNLSFMSIQEAVRIMNQEDYNAVKCIESQYDMIAKVIALTSNVLENKGRIIYMGAGTSGRLGVLDAVECPPTFNVDANTVIGLIAGGETAFVKAVEGAEDSKELGEEELRKIQLCADDIVIGIAASGRTPYVIGGLKYAQSINAATCAIVCNPHSEIKKITPLTIEIVPGPEVLTGSTRLKAATATKMVLNMISTISMIRIGKIYQNYMVDVKMSNEKLFSRGTNIVCSVTCCTKETALKALEEAKGNVRLAIVMILLDCDSLQAKEALLKVNGRIQDLIDEEE